jgi:hypothetical protein
VTMMPDPAASVAPAQQRVTETQETGETLLQLAVSARAAAGGPPATAKAPISTIDTPAL